MDSKQSKVQTDRVRKFQKKNCSTGLRFCTWFMNILVASGVFEEGVWFVLASALWRQALLQNFGPFAVCKEADLDNICAILESIPGFEFSSIHFTSVPWPIGSSGWHEGRFSRDSLPVFSAGGHCEQFWHGQGHTLKKKKKNRPINKKTHIFSQ